MNVLRPLWLIARSVLIEAVRRREVYAVVLVSVVLIGAVMMVDFFKLEGLTKFYREVALQTMSLATALTVVILAARQLPREFETRTIYPLLAKPVGRTTFLFGKLAGVMLAAAFCYSLFMAIFLAGSFYLKSEIPWALFAQYLYLQMIKMLILAALSFWLSLIVNLDAAVTLGVVFYAASAIIMTAVSYLYDLADPFTQKSLVAMTYVLPMLSLFDLSEKVVHAAAWTPIPAWAMSALTLYGGGFAALYIGFAWFCFRRRPL